MSDCLLEVRDLRTHFRARRGGGGVAKAVDGVSFTLRQGEVLGLVGESGCGKSTLARAIVQLAPVTGGSVLFEGRSLSGLPGGELRRLRPRLQMIFQDPYASLNPRRTVFDTIAEPMLEHKLVARAEMTGAVGELMEKVGLARRFMRKYPHEFSGGQRQRIAIARALALRPRLILADEPVSALDVSVQAQILNLLQTLRKDEDLTMVLISHDLSVVKHMADRIAVMYLGRLVEVGDAQQVLDEPLHPYTKALVSAVPVPDPKRERSRRRVILSGDPPSPLSPPSGCAFHPRCPFAADECSRITPALEGQGHGREAACLRLEEIGIEECSSI
jgi:oligopeptide transport system ATP-binding protein